MKIAILGGTGKLGLAFAVRLNRSGHETGIGSRDVTKAEEAAKSIAGNSGRKRDIIEVVRSMGLHPVDAGPLEVAAHLERITVLLLSINKTNKVKESGIKITGT